MESIKEQVTDFLDKCEELRKCKFIVAPTKIKDILKSIVNNPELYELFNTVTAEFDYVNTKARCLVDTSDGIISRGYVVLPDSVGERLAFIFCLLVEFDKDTINFNSFLEHFYPEEGSFYLSFRSFCDTIIDSLEKMIYDIYSSELNSAEIPNLDEAPVEPNSDIAQALSTLAIYVSIEKENISLNNIPEDEKDAGYSILDELYEALKSGKISTVNALVCGYNYYLLYHNCVSEKFEDFLEAISIYEDIL